MENSIPCITLIPTDAEIAEMDECNDALSDAWQRLGASIEKVSVDMEGKRYPYAVACHALSSKWAVIPTR